MSVFFFRGALLMICWFDYPSRHCYVDIACSKHTQYSLLDSLISDRKRARFYLASCSVLYLPAWWHKCSVKHGLRTAVQWHSECMFLLDYTSRVLVNKEIKFRIELWWPIVTIDGFRKQSIQIKLRWFL